MPEAPAPAHEIFADSVRQIKFLCENFYLTTDHNSLISKDEKMHLLNLLCFLFNPWVLPEE